MPLAQHSNYHAAVLMSPYYMRHADTGVPGITLDTVSGVLSGTAIHGQPHPSTVNIVARNTVGESSEVALTVAVRPPAPASLAAAIVINEIYQDRAAAHTFADAQTAGFRSWERVRSVLRDAKELMDRATEERLMAPVRARMVDITRRNTLIMAKLVQGDVANDRSYIVDQAEGRENVVEQLYASVAASHHQLTQIQVEISSQVGAISSALKGMPDAYTQGIANHFQPPTWESPEELIQKIEDLCKDANNAHQPVDALIGRVATVVDAAAKAAQATATAVSRSADPDLYDSSARARQRRLCTQTNSTESLPAKVTLSCKPTLSLLNLLRRPLKKVHMLQQSGLKSFSTDASLHP